MATTVLAQLRHLLPPRKRPPGARTYSLKRQLPPPPNSQVLSHGLGLAFSWHEPSFHLKSTYKHGSERTCVLQRALSLPSRHACLCVCEPDPGGASRCLREDGSFLQWALSSRNCSCAKGKGHLMRKSCIPRQGKNRNSRGVKIVFL